MFEDGDINYTRHIRGVVNAVIAPVTGDTMFPLAPSTRARPAAA